MCCIENPLMLRRNRDTGWKVLGAAGFEGVRMVAIDEDWLAVRFRRVEFIKAMNRDVSGAMTSAGKARTSKHSRPSLRFGIFCLPAIRNLMSGREIPFVMGFPAYGRGRSSVLAFPPQFRCSRHFCSNAHWKGSPAGCSGWAQGWCALAVALLPLGGIFWWGFALPFPPLFAAIRTALIVFSWRTLR